MLREIQRKSWTTSAEMRWEKKPLGGITRRSEILVHLMMPFLPFTAIKKRESDLTLNAQSFKCIISTKSSKHSHSSLWQKYSGVSLGPGKKAFELWMRSILMGRPFFIIVRGASLSHRPFPSTIIKFYVLPNFTMLYRFIYSRWVSSQLGGDVNGTQWPRREIKIDRH